MSLKVLYNPAVTAEAAGSSSVVPAIHKRSKAKPPSPIGIRVLNSRNMEVTLHIPDEIAKRLSATGAGVSRRALEAIALEGYREQTLTPHQVSEMLGLSRVETEDFLGEHHVPLAVIDKADLDREAALFETATRRDRR
jgi:Uncharacterised protein family (UPF0175)